MRMKASFRAFGDRLIDYAGMFPPAELPMEAAVANYAAYRARPEAWLLGRFICAASRLEHLDAGTAWPPEPATTSGPAAQRNGRGTAAEAGVVALVRPGHDPEEFLSGLRQDLALVARFNDQWAGVAHVDVMEARAPASLESRSTAEWSGFLGAVQGELETAGVAQMRFFVECGWGQGWRDSVGRAAAAIAEGNATRAASGAKANTAFAPTTNDAKPAPAAIPGAAHATSAAPEGGVADAVARFGLKLRCGGVTADAIPHPEQVAGAIATVVGSLIPWKATAGLHHPIRSHRPEVDAPMHGFINVFGAALLAASGAISMTELQPVIEDEDPRSFNFTDEAFQWRGRSVATADVRRLRRSIVGSFGSCSFEEPTEDLRALGLLV